MTPNQIVAANLRRARRLRDEMTQDEAAKLLEPYLGERWTRARWSQAERSIVGKRVRPFSADEVAAFSQAFDLPVPWFLMPPAPEEKGDPPLPEEVTLGDKTVPLGNYLDTVYIGELTEEMTFRILSLASLIAVETQERVKERLRPLLLGAMKEAAQDLLELVSDLGTAQERLQDAYAAMANVQIMLDKVVSPIVFETLGIEEQKGEEE